MKKHKFLKTLLSSLMALSVISTAAIPAVAEEAEAEMETEVFEEPAETTEAEEVLGNEEEALDAEGGEVEVEVEVEPEPEEEPAEGIGNLEFEKSADDVTVTAAAPEGAFPEGTEMTAETVTDTEVLDVIKSVVGENAEVLAAVDITFTSEGETVQPDEAVKVAFAAAGITYSDDLKVVHIHDEAAEGEEPQLTATVLDQEAVYATEDGNVAFDADSFSVYAVVRTGENARLTVKFMNGENEIASTVVKKSDINATTESGASLFDQIVYDPGAGTLGSGQVFRGWTTKSNYTVDDVADGMSIEGVRDDVKSKLNAGIADGDQVTYYAMVFTIYNIVYKDEDGVVIKHDSRLTQGDAVEYEINEAYVPKTTDQEFQGWYFTADKAVINKATGEEYATGSTIENETTVIINSSVTLTVKAPKGAWLIFKENAKGATFTPPQFLEGTNPTEPTNPTYYAHTFAGWYLDAACTDGNEFDAWNVPLEKTTTVYAKWTPNTTAKYTIIIWKQNVNDSKNAADSAKTYDFATSISKTGNVNDLIEDVTATGNGNNRYASVSGTSYRYDGFHLRTYDSNVTVDVNGTSVVNVYYDRNEITITFQYRSNWSWQTQATMTGLYGQTLTQNGYTWPTNRWWYTSYEQSWGSYYGTGTNLTFLDAFIIPAAVSSNTTNLTLYGFQGSGNYTVRFYKQNADGSYPSAATNTVTIDQGGFSITDKYNGYKAVQYSTNGTTWTDLGDPDDNGLYASPSFTQNLYIRFAPRLYNLQYNDGVYVDGETGAAVEGYSSRGELLVKKDIPYGSSLASYNKGGANYYDPTFDGFVFAGWYVDDACTQPMTFTNMPEGLKVYAKWVQVAYRVFLNPDVPTSETTFSMGGQSTSFRVSYGGEIAKINAIRDDYELVGWYMDSAKTKPYNFDAYVLNDDITTNYDKTRSTETDKYGNPTASTNADKDRYWITRSLDLYAKWRSKLLGANGITVTYDAVDGTFANGDTSYNDPLLYKDLAMSTATTATTPTDTKKFEFSHWVVQKWNGSEFEDTNETVLPGDNFVVKKAYAHVKENAGSTTEKPSYTYTVKLRAQYKAIEEETKTHIYWYANNGTDAKVEDNDLKMNQPVDIEPWNRFKYETYVFVGWARYEAGEKPESPTDTSHLWLDYNRDTGEFTCRTENNAVVTQVACDEKEPYHDLYAIWEQGYTVMFSSDLSTKTYKLSDKVDDLVQLVNEHNAEKVAADENAQTYLYGGYYHYDTKVDGLESYRGTAEQLAITVPDKTKTGYWQRFDPYTVAWSTLTNEQKLGKTFFVKEVPDYYFAPYLQYYFKTGSGFLTQMFAVTAMDDARYAEIGFARLNSDTENYDGKLITYGYNGKAFEVNPLPLKMTKCTSVLTFTPTNGEAENLTANGVVKNRAGALSDADGYIASAPLIGLAHSNNGEVPYKVTDSFRNTIFNYIPYYVTHDGVTVVGNYLRRVDTGNGYNTTLTLIGEDILNYTVNDIKTKN